MFRLWSAKGQPESAAPRIAPSEHLAGKMALASYTARPGQLSPGSTPSHSVGCVQGTALGHEVGQCAASPGALTGRAAQRGTSPGI